MGALADINIKKNPQEIVCGNFVIAIVISSAATMNSQHIIGNSKYLPSLYYKTRKIGNIKSHDIDIAVIIFPLKWSSPPCIVLPEAFSVVNLYALK